MPRIGWRETCLAWAVAHILLGLPLNLLLLPRPKITAEAIAASTLFGPAQVVARIFEASVLARFLPLVSARLATISHPIALVVAFSGCGLIAGAFAVLDGLGNGIITIARGTMPLSLFGPLNYGYRLGIMARRRACCRASRPCFSRC